MKVKKDEITKPNRKKIKFAITELTEQEYKTICKGLAALADDETATAMLHTFKALADE